VSHDDEHVPVLLADVLELLRPRPGGLAVDGTLGRGGHAAALVDAGMRLVGADRDPRAVSACRARLGGHVELHHAAFSELPRLLGGRRADAILLDLGVSSPQLDRPERGFSFQHDGPLDMRQDDTRGATLAEVLDGIAEAELADAIWRFGEERLSRRVAGAILAARPLRGTAHLADVVRSVVPRSGRIDPATRTFQALRILVNRELDELDDALRSLPDLLAPGGRFAVIAFHSLEDTRVKARFGALAGVGAPVDLYGHPVVAPAFRLVERRARKGDTDPNPRARSARLRALEKLP
jgi:16S rRNA (cytosine1402-N4)-methyltransferase